MDYLELKTELQKFLPVYLEKMADKFREEQIRVFDVGCFPWHGGIELSFLTANEDNFEKEYGKYSMGNWRLYSFNQEIYEKEWGPMGSICYKMRECWESSDEYRQKSDELFMACAEVAASKQVRDAFKYYNLTSDFEINVFHPDCGTELNYMDKLTKPSCGTP
jgi:hypothetical protein